MMHHLLALKNSVIAVVFVALLQEITVRVYASRIANEDEADGGFDKKVTPLDYIAPGHQAELASGDIYGPVHDPFGHYAHHGWAYGHPEDAPAFDHFDDHLAVMDYDYAGDPDYHPADVHVHSVVHPLHGSGHSMLESNSKTAPQEAQEDDSDTIEYDDDDPPGDPPPGEKLSEKIEHTNPKGHAVDKGRDVSHEDHFSMHDDHDITHDSGDPGYYGHDYGHHDEKEDHKSDLQEHDVAVDYWHGYSYYGHDYGHHEVTEDHFDRHEQHSEDGHVLGQGRGRFPGLAPKAGGHHPHFDGSTQIGKGRHGGDPHDPAHDDPDDHLDSLAQRSSESDHKDPHNLGIMFEDGGLAADHDARQAKTAGSSDDAAKSAKQGRGQKQTNKAEKDDKIRKKMRKE